MIRCVPADRACEYHIVDIDGENKKRTSIKRPLKVGSGRLRGKSNLIILKVYRAHVSSHSETLSYGFQQLDRPFQMRSPWY